MPLAQGNVEDIYPLAPMQEGMLFHSLYGEGGPPPLLQWSCRMDRLDAGSFEQAWKTVVGRHTALRTAFLTEEVEEPVQVVLRRVDLPWKTVDLRSVTPGERSEQIRLRAASDRAPFSLSDAPLMRFSLFRLTDTSWQFVWTFHLLLLDGWSTAAVVNEVFGLYEAYARGENLELEPVRKYRDFIAWHRQQDRSQAERFWRAALAGVTAPTALAVERTPALAPGAEAEFDQIEERCSAGLSEALQAFARRNRLTFNTIVRGAWALLLSRYSGEGTVVFGATTSGRPAELRGVESMVGLFINTLPVRVDVPEDESVLSWLARLQEQQSQLLEHESSRLVDVQGWSEVPRGLPLFESVLVVQTFPVDDALRERQRRLGITDAGSFERTNVPLTVQVRPGTELSVSIGFDSSRFDASTIRRMFAHYRTLLERIIEDGSRRISEISCLSDEEERRILYEWNATGAELPPEQTIHALFERQAKRSPDAFALLHGTDRLTYGELNARANRLAHCLRGRGLGPGALVGVCLERTPSIVVALLGILKSGAAYVALDPAYPEARVAFMLEDAKVPLVVTQEGLSDRLPPGSFDRVRIDADWPAISREPAEDLSPASGGADLAYVIYTSGSTGNPKGVAIEHRNAVAFLGWARDRFRGIGVEAVLASTSVCFDLSIFEIFAPLASGGMVVLAQGALELPVLPGAAEVRLINTVPSAIGALLALGPGAIPDTVVTVNLAGEPLPTSLVRDILEKTAVRRVFDLYGPSEDTTYSTYTERFMDAPATIGRPLANKRSYILDAGLRPVPVGVPGDLYVAGLGVARGYLGRPELTAERFLPEPFRDGGRMYRTGDRARFLEDGSIQFLGRLDHQVKIRGFRIEIGEVEEALRRQPGVAKCVVVARDEDGDKRLVAYVVSSPGEAVSASGLRDALRVSLPEFMIPSAFVFLEDLPLTPNGKIDRRALPSPDTTRESLESALTRPRTPIEEVLIGIWTEVLRTPAVGVHDNFFDLGGHSILATRVFSRIRDSFGVDVPLRHLFEGPTVAQLALRIESARQAGLGTQPPPLRRVSRDGDIPLSFAQQRLWFLDQLDPGASSYNARRALRLKGTLDSGALEKALFEITARHESLRTTFENREGRAVQVVSTIERFPLVLRDLFDVRVSDREREALRMTNEEVNRPFDLKTGPLFRAVLFRLGPEDHILLLVIHHIVCDGWSMGVLLRELGALYGALVRGEPSPLPPVGLQYADCAVWERDWIQGEVLEKQLSYWTEQLQGAAPVLDLRGDRPRPEVRGGKGARLSFDLPIEVAEKVSRLGRTEGSTLYMTLLAALGVLLWHQTGQEDIVVGSPVAGRNRVEMEGVIGLFINTIVIRIRLEGNPSFRELMQRVREAALSAYTHQEVPFERLVDALKVERSLSHNPLFQVWFVLQNSGGPPPALEALSVEEIALETEAIRHDLQLSVEETSDALNVQWDYATDIFDAPTVERLEDRFEVLLLRILDHSEIPLATLRGAIDDDVRQRQHQKRKKLEMDSVMKLKESRRKAVRSAGTSV